MPTKKYALKTGETVELSPDQVKMLTALFGEDYVQYLDAKDAARKAGPEVTFIPEAKRTLPAPFKFTREQLLKGITTGPQEGHKAAPPDKPISLLASVFRTETVPAAKSFQAGLEGRVKR